MYTDLQQLPFSQLNNDSFGELIDAHRYCENIQISDLDYPAVRFIDSGNNENAIATNEWDIDNNFTPYKAMANSQYNECKYFSTETFKANVQQYKNNMFSIMHYNIRSSVAHNDEFYVNLVSLEHKFSVIGMCETWLKPSNCHLYGLNGYETEQKCRDRKKGGGVALYINNAIPYKRRPDFESIFDISDAEIVCIELSGKIFNTKPIIVAEIYRPPFCRFYNLHGSIYVKN
jgi:hypothetical protein